MITAQYFSYLIIIAFFLMDFVMRSGNTAKKLKPNGGDKRSTFLLITTFFIILLLTDFIQRKAIGQFKNSYLQWFSILMMITGLVIRIISIKTLKNSYTRTLIIEDRQELFTSGIYKFIRHPGYLGTLMVWIFFGLAQSNYIAFAVNFILISSAYIYRIKQEERMLIKVFGKKYLDYKNTSKAIVPFLI